MATGKSSYAERGRLLAERAGSPQLGVVSPSARCGCSSTCGCCLTAGSGISITGTGNTGNCYTIAASGTDCEAVQDCVGAAITAGTGATYNDAGNSISVLPSTDVGNQIVQGGDGRLFVPPAAFSTCEQIQDCIGTAVGNGQGITYNDAADSFSVCLSADAGNAVVFGSDGCLYVPTSAAGGTVIQVTDTPTVDLTITGNGMVGTPYVISGVVNLSADVGQILHLGSDGRFYLSCADVLACVPQTTMASAKITMSNTQTVPASAGGTSASLLNLMYNATEFSTGPITTGATGITINQTGRYLIEGSQRDHQTGNTNEEVPGAFHSVAMIIRVNGVQVANVSMDRAAKQTRVPTPHTELNLNAGDVVTTQYLVHRSNGSTTPQTLDGDANLDFLSVQQIPMTVRL